MIADVYIKMNDAITVEFIINQMPSLEDKINDVHVAFCFHIGNMLIQQTCTTASFAYRLPTYQ